MKNFAATFFVTIQLSILGYFALTSKWIPANLFLDLLVFGGTALAIWAIIIADPRRVNIRPLPHPAGKLVTRGPYHLIRHPMYSAQLLVTLAWMIDKPLTSNILIWLIYLVILMVKLQFEEANLKLQFEGYSGYMKKTWRLLPFIW